MSDLLRAVLGQLNLWFSALLTRLMLGKEMSSWLIISGRGWKGIRAQNITWLGQRGIFLFFFLDFIWILQKETAALFKPNLNGNIIYRRLQNAVDWGFSVCLHMMSPFNTCLCQAPICPRRPQRCSVAHAQLVVSPAQPLGSKDKALSCVFTSWLCFLLPIN